MEEEKKNQKEKFFEELQLTFNKVITSSSFIKFLTDPFTSLLKCCCLSPLIHLSRALHLKYLTKKLTKYSLIMILVLYLAFGIFLFCFSIMTTMSYLYMKRYPTKIVSHRDLSDHWGRSIKNRIPLNVGIMIENQKNILGEKKKSDFNSKRKKLKMKSKKKSFQRYISNVLLKKENEILDLKGEKKRSEKIKDYLGKIQTDFFDYFYPDDKIYKLGVVIGVKNLDQREFQGISILGNNDISLKLEILYLTYMGKNEPEFKLKSFNSIMQPLPPEEPKTSIYESILGYNPMSFFLRKLGNIISKFKKILIFLISDEQDLGTKKKDSLGNISSEEVIFFKSGLLHLTPSSTALCLSAIMKIQSKFQLESVILEVETPISVFEYYWRQYGLFALIVLSGIVSMIIVGCFYGLIAVIAIFITMNSKNEKVDNMIKEEKTVEEDFGGID